MNYTTFKTTDTEKGYVKRMLSTLDFNPWPTLPGTPEQRQIGTEGQMKVAQFFYVPFGEMRLVIDGRGDPGFDIVVKGQKADIKVLLNDYNPQPHYSVNVPDRQLKKEKDIGIFVIYNRKNQTFFLLGWWPIKELKPEWFHKAGTFKQRKEGSWHKYPIDTWDIEPISILKPISELQ